MFFLVFVLGLFGLINAAQWAVFDAVRVVDKNFVPLNARAVLVNECLHCRARLECFGGPHGLMLLRDDVQRECLRYLSDDVKRGGDGGGDDDKFCDALPLFGGVGGVGV